MAITYTQSTIIFYTNMHDVTWTLFSLYTVTKKKETFEI